MNPAALLRRSVPWLLGWVLVASVMQLVGDVLLLGTSGHVTKFSPIQTLLLPVNVLLHPLDPAAAFGVHSDELRGWLYLLLFLIVAAGTWVTLLRHGYGNPLTAGRADDLTVPLARQLTPKAKDVGIWVPHDAARNAPEASWRDRMQVRLLRQFAPDKDLARAMTRRGNGMMVPFDGPQPAARILLGHIRYLHLFRRRKYNVYARPEQHVVIFGPSGAGKGATQMNPSLLFWNGEISTAPDGHGAGWPGPIITSTVKHDHVDTALEWRLSLSDQCFVYDPLQSYPEFKRFWVGWDPIKGITNFSEANAVALALMESESQQAGGGGENADYFKAQALMVLAPMMLSAGLAGSPFRTVYDWALRLESEFTDQNVVAADGEVDPNSRMYAVMDKLYEYAETTGDETPLNQMQQIFMKDPREASGVWGTIRKALQPYNDEKSVQSTDSNFMQILDPKKFYSTPHATLFIIAPEVANEAKRMRPVFAAFITWLIEEAQKLARERNGKLPYPVLANLDEVKNVGAIPGLAHTLSLTRSIGFFVKHAWQDEAQIASAYGKDDAKTITSNSRTWVILPGISDPDHLEALARLIGERPVKRRGKGPASGPDDAQRTKAANASMIKEIKDNELLILTDNLPPFVIEASRYFQDPIMLARWKMGDLRRESGVTPDPAELRRHRVTPTEDAVADRTAASVVRPTPAQEQLTRFAPPADAAGHDGPAEAPWPAAPVPPTSGARGSAALGAPASGDAWRPMVPPADAAGDPLEPERHPLRGDADRPTAPLPPAAFLPAPYEAATSPADVSPATRPTPTLQEMLAGLGIDAATPPGPAWDDRSAGMPPDPAPAADLPAANSYARQVVEEAAGSGSLSPLDAFTGDQLATLPQPTDPVPLSDLFAEPAVAPVPAADSGQLGEPAGFVSAWLTADTGTAPAAAAVPEPVVTAPGVIDQPVTEQPVTASCADCGMTFSTAGMDDSQAAAVVARHRAAAHRPAPRPPVVPAPRPQAAAAVDDVDAAGWDPITQAPLPGEGPAGPAGSGWQRPDLDV